jgi:hypothetical protein
MYSRDKLSSLPLTSPMVHVEENIMIWAYKYVKVRGLSFHHSSTRDRKLRHYVSSHSEGDNQQMNFGRANKSCLSLASQISHRELDNYSP